VNALAFEDTTAIMITVIEIMETVGNAG